jgi:hypothetical protein
MMRDNMNNIYKNICLIIFVSLNIHLYSQGKLVNCNLSGIYIKKLVSNNLNIITLFDYKIERTPLDCNSFELNCEISVSDSNNFVFSHSFVERIDIINTDSIKRDICIFNLEHFLGFARKKIKTIVPNSLILSIENANNPSIPKIVMRAFEMIRNGENELREAIIKYFRTGVNNYDDPSAIYQY